MTFSIIARDTETGLIGVATATGKIAVGAQVPHLRPGVGAIATQGFTTNPLYAEAGFQLLEAGQSAKDVVSTLTKGDDGRDWRQVLVMDRDGGTAGMTGVSNETAFGIIEANGLIVGGNMLANKGVLSAMKDAYERAADPRWRRGLSRRWRRGKRMAVISVAPALPPCWSRTRPLGHLISALILRPISWAPSTISTGARRKAAIVTFV